MSERSLRIYEIGAAADSIRETDWSATSLGSISQWRDVLLNMVNMVLGASIPMQLFWGRSLSVSTTTL